MRIERQAGAPGAERHECLGKGLAIFPAVNEEPWGFFEQGSDVASFQMFFPSLTFLIPMIICLL